MMPPDLESLREIMKDRRVWVSLGKITKIEYASNKSSIRVKVLLFPDNHEIVAKVGAMSVAPDAGDYGPISVNDMALIAIPEGLEDYAHVVCRLPSNEDTIPQQAIDGDTISKSKSGKRNILWGQTKAQVIGGDRINLAKTDSDVLEPLILGLVMQQAYENALLRLSTLIDKMMAGPMTIGNLPGLECPTHPQFILDLQAIKDDIDADKELYSTDQDTNFLSQLSFTERGGA
jgi:hypothetical protein